VSKSVSAKQSKHKTDEGECLGSDLLPVARDPGCLIVLLKHELQHVQDGLL
jgi:hypothetical protein